MAPDQVIADRELTDPLDLAPRAAAPDRVGAPEDEVRADDLEHLPSMCMQISGKSIDVWWDVLLYTTAMGVERAVDKPIVAYVDHLVVEDDSKNAEDQILLRSVARRFGWWYSRPGNGTSHPVHQQRFGIRGGRSSAPTRTRRGRVGSTCSGSAPAASRSP